MALTNVNREAERTTYRVGSQTGNHVCEYVDRKVLRQYVFSICEDCGWWGANMTNTGPRGGGLGGHVLLQCRCGLESE